MSRRLFVLVFALLAGSAAQAQFVRPDDATTSSQFNTSSFGIINTINGTGLPGGFDETGTHAAYASNNHWTTANGGVAGVTATFIFNTARNLDAFHLWNHLSTQPFAGSNNYAVSTFNLRFYNGSGSLVGSLLNQSAAKNVATAQTYEFAEIQNVLSVVFTVLSNHGDAGYTGLAEVGFRAVPAVPEPAHFGGVAALIVLGCALARRRLAQRAA